MVYKIVYSNIGNCKQLFQTWKTGSFMNGSSRMNASQYSGRFNGSDHEYTLSEPTAVANGADWLHLSTFPCSKDTLRGSTRFLNTLYLENSFSWTPVNILAIYTGSSHEYTLSYPTAVANGADWLHFNTIINLLFVSMWQQTKERQKTEYIHRIYTQ